jgi:hypothetical protein
MLLTRPGTFGQLIYEHVVKANEYDLPDRFDPADVIVDVGAHIGATSRRVLQDSARFDEVHSTAELPAVARGKRLKGRGALASALRRWP